MVGRRENNTKRALWLIARCAARPVLPSDRLHLASRLTPPGVETPVNLALYRCPTPARPAMDQEALRLLIRRRIHDRRLPHDGVRTVWSTPSDGETCDACDTVLTKDQLLMEGCPLDLGRRPFQMHVRCFQMWDHERRAA
jgi:hypothetical protein